MDLAAAATIISAAPEATPGPALVDSLSAWGGFLADAVQVGAIIVGGWWAYTKFIRQREKEPRATLEHQIQHFDLDQKDRLIRVEERLMNTGTVLLEIRERITRVQQVLPSHPETRRVLEEGVEQEAPWPVLGEHVTDDDLIAVIEPGESDQFEHDFLIGADPVIIQVYSYFKNIKREDRPLGWHMTTTYDLRTKEMVHHKAEDLRSKEE